MSDQKAKSTINTIISGTLVVSALVTIGLAATVPFYFETTTLWYKTGLDKTLLRSGQVVGMIALCLLFLQVIIAVRGVFLETWFGAARLMWLHRLNGLVIGVLVSAHVLFVLLPEGLAHLPIGQKYLPEMIGGVALMAIIATTLFSYFRTLLKISYQRWRIIHRLLGFLIVVAVVVHVLFVSEVFRSGILRSLLITTSSGVILYVVVVKFLYYLKK